LEKRQIKGDKPPGRQDAAGRPKEKGSMLSVLMIVLAGVLVYGNSLRGELLWDDINLVQTNPFIKDWSYLPQIFLSSIRSGAGEVTNFYRPVQFLIYGIGYSFWQLNVAGYHCVSVLVHVLAALSVYRLTGMLFQDGLLARLTGILFVIHPVHTEAVSYISGVADPLAALFMLWCFALYIKGFDQGSFAQTAAMCLVYVLALLSRENSLILPALIWLYHKTFDRPVAFKRLGALVATAVVYIIWRWVLSGNFLAEGVVHPPLMRRLPGMFVALTEYVRLLMAPFNLHMEYGGLLFDFREWRVFAGIVFLIILMVCAFKGRKQNRLLSFSAGWFLIALIPSSNIFPINAYMAEHWLYLPSLGFFWALSCGIRILWRGEKTRAAAVGVTVLLCVFFAALTLRQNRYWRDAVTFYTRMLKLVPYSSRLYNNLAMAYHEKGQEEKLVALLRNAVEIDRDNAVAYNNLGNALKNLDRHDESITAYEEAIRLNPGYSGAYYNLGLIYADVKGQKGKAVELFTKAVEIEPLFYQGYHKIGLLRFEEGKVPEAVALLKKAQGINPDDAELYRSLGYIYIHSGEAGRAKEMYQKALKLNPRFAQVYNDLCVIYISGQDYQTARPYCEGAKALNYDVSSALEILKDYR
jgi:tetratricopeptide (TPR) repeat protein